MPCRQRRSSCSADFNRISILPQPFSLLEKSENGDASEVFNRNDPSLIFARKIVRTVGFFDVSGVSPGARAANSFLHQAARSRTFAPEILYSVFPGAVHTARAAAHAAYRRQTNGAMSSSSLSRESSGRGDMTVADEGTMSVDETAVSMFAYPQTPGQNSLATESSECIADIAANVSISALLLPAPLFTFLAKVDEDELESAVASILWDAAPGEFPASRAPCPPTRHSHSLDNVLLNLGGRAPGADFWQIPVQAVFIEPLAPFVRVHRMIDVD